MVQDNSDKQTIVVIPEDGMKNITVEDFYDKTKYNLSTMKEEDLYKLLDTSNDGLNDDQVRERLEKFGSNMIEQKEKNPILKFLSFMWNPLSWVMEIAALVSIVVSNGGGQPPSWQDFLGIVVLLLINSTIGYIEERNAGNAIKALQSSLALQSKVKRSGQWTVIETSDLVPGDIISLKLGDVVPADARVIVTHGQVAMNEAALTGESLPVKKNVGDLLLSGAICEQGETEAIVIGTGTHSFMGKTISLIGDNSDVGHLQMVMGHIGIFCIVSIVLFLIVQILVMYAGYRYNYRRGINNLLVILVGGIPTAMPTVLSVTLAIGAKQLSKHKAIVTHITAIEELAAVTILCSDKTGTLTLNKLVIDKTLVKQYSDVDTNQIIRYAAIASRTQHQDAIDACITRAYDNDLSKIREGIQELEFKPFNPTDKRTEITYKSLEDESVHRITKGMSRVILNLCSRDKTPEIIKRLNDDVDEFAGRGLRSLAVAIEDLADEDIHGKGNGFKLIGLLPIFDPPREDTKETISRAIQLGVKVKMITGDQLAIAKETGRRLSMGDNMYPSIALDQGPPADSNYDDIDDLVLHADGFSGVYPEHKYQIIERLQNLGHIVAMTGDGVNDAAALRKANVGIAVADASDAARSSSDIVLTEPGLSVIIEAILGARKIFQRMRNYSICTCSITTRILVGFSILVFAFRYDFPSFMILILTFLNDSTIMTVAKDRVEASPYPNSWHLSEVFIQAIVYGVYLALSTVVFFIVTVKTSFFQDKFGVDPIVERSSNEEHPGWDDPMLHSIIYLQTSIISQALIFVVRSRSFFFLERPSLMLVIAFIIAQTAATFIAVYANWSFVPIEGCGWSWAGIVWIWNLIWFLPLDLIKFCLQMYFDRRQRETIEESLQTGPSTKEQRRRRENLINEKEKESSSLEISISTPAESRQLSTIDSVVEATAKYYTTHTEYFSTPQTRHHQFLKRIIQKKRRTQQVPSDPDNLRQFSLAQNHHPVKSSQLAQHTDSSHQMTML